MNPINIISACQSIQALNNLKSERKDSIKSFNLSKHEAQTLSKFIYLLKENGIESNCFNGYYIGYSINQISKEFDLLRFSDNLVVNIELKAPLKEEIKLQKINAQMNHNYYYLKFLNKEIFICTYIEDDCIYKYNALKEQPQKIDVSELENVLLSQKTDYSINPDNLFIPSNYLISPFNSTDKFINGEYFLTDHQSNIKKDILEFIEKNEFITFCISANAGTGKTLLAYDLARHLLQCKKSPLIIHCGKLNNGHYKLISLGWKIKSIRNINREYVDSWSTKKVELIIVDESQRISSKQLNLIIEKSIELKIPIMFTYDTNQYLREDEKQDIFDYIKIHYQDTPIKKYELTNKIRTNKEISSFIKNLVHKGSSNSYLDYTNITIEYFDEIKDVKKYINDLQYFYGWKAITFTRSQYYKETIDEISNICTTKAHDVIGQEFKKIVFVMDLNFRYNNNGILTIKPTYYSAQGMLYQIVTRAVDELKIVVLNNPVLFLDLLAIKHKQILLKENEKPL